MFLERLFGDVNAVIILFKEDVDGDHMLKSREVELKSSSPD